MPTTNTEFDDPRLNAMWFYDGSSNSPLSIDIASVWEDYRGEGVTVGVVDSQIEYTHRDLAHAYDQTLDYNFALDTGDLSFRRGDLEDRHGTMVAGVIAGGLDNGTGGAGYAPEVSLVGLALSYGDDNVIDQMVRALHAAVELDVVNNSWSFSSNFSDNFATAEDARYGAAVERLATEGRDGLGTVNVFSAGNGGAKNGSNYHDFQNSPYTIAVGGFKDDGAAWESTSLGANVLVSAGGRGIATTTLSNKYTVATGTSFAAPTVSAVVALMLEANPELGYRDVQQILSLSAVRTGLSDDPLEGDGWRINGADNHNGGGMHYSDALGYGAVNAHNAVRLAETWTDRQTTANRQEVTAHVDPDAQLIAGKRDQVSVEIEIDAALQVEHVELSLNLEKWPSTGNLDIYLVSPEGTSVRLLYSQDGRHVNGDINGFGFGSVGTMGEMAAGTWTLHVVNRDPEATRGDAPMTGLLDDVTLTIYGDGDGFADDTYVYTDEFAQTATAARSVLQDVDGGTDAINAAAVTSDTRVDLSAGRAEIAGVDIVIRNPGRIENVFAGDGNDVLTGNDGDNWLRGGRGDDLFRLTAGTDVIDGGVGTDALRVDAAFAAVTGFLTKAGTLMLGLAGQGLSKVTGVESFSFADVTYSLGEVTARLDGAEAPPPAEDPADKPADPPETEDPGTTPPPEPPQDETPGDGPADEEPTVIETPGDGPGSVYQYLYMGTGQDDRLVGSDENDDIRGGAGDDQGIGHRGDDRLDGGDGADTLNGGNGNDIVLGGSGDDRLRGGSGADKVEGGAGSDRLNGDAGNDRLLGGAARDVLKGGAGRDVLDGGAGRDVLYGGDGADTFRFDLADGTDMDVIRDFDRSEGDRVIIEGLDEVAGWDLRITERNGASMVQLETDAGNLRLLRSFGEELELLTLDQASDGQLVLG